MGAAISARSANPHHRRPARYAIAIAIAVTLVLVLVASSILNYVYLDTVAGSTSLYGLLAIALVAVVAFATVRALVHDQAERRRQFMRAGVVLGVAALCWLLLVDVIVFTYSAGLGVAAVCALACLPTTGFALLVLRALDRNETEPWRLVLLAAAWGAVVATSLVIWAESLWQAIAIRTLVPGPGLDVSTAFSAGILEELAKGSAVVLLFLVMRNEFDDVVDGIIYGAAVGLGFNFMESVSYMTHLYAVFSPEGLGGEAAGFQWYARQVLGLFFGHATYTAFVGAGVGIARQLPDVRQKIFAIAAGFIVAIGAHFSWDAWLSAFPIDKSLEIVEIHMRTLIISGPFTAALLAVLFTGIYIEGQALAGQFRKEAALGTGAILPEEVSILMNPWQRFQQRVRAMGRGGLRAYLLVARLQSAQIDLAMERWHRERNEIDAPPEADGELRRRVIRLREQLAAAVA
ncbi:MAG TPA: PrsW family intramembrane metalloprotease [Candidatus Dormibacteraeota bacterium]